MGKDKLIEKTTQEITKGNNMILQYAPILVGMICLIICYLLFKKIKTLNSQSDSVSKLEKQFTGFIKEQSEINSISGKKLSNVMGQINHLGHVVNNFNEKIETISKHNVQTAPRVQNNQVHNIVQPTPQHKVQLPVQPPVQPPAQPPVQNPVQAPEQPPSREMMPTNVIQTQHPINSSTDKLPPPKNTSGKKETVVNVETFKSDRKNVINLTPDETIIEEASSDED